LAQMLEVILQVAAAQPLWVSPQELHKRDQISLLA